MWASANANEDLIKPLSRISYQEILEQGDLSSLERACMDAAKFSLDSRLRELSNRLMDLSLRSQSFDERLVLAKALMRCKAPENAQKLLSSINFPQSSGKWREWLMLSWEAANGAIDHPGAALALKKLSNGTYSNLDNEKMIVGYEKDGSPITKSALDVLADHERYSGNLDAASKVLMAGRTGGSIGARRLALAAQLMKTLNQEKRRNLLGIALNNALEDKAWWLVEDILRLQLIYELAAGGDGKLLKQSLERLSIELDDSYTLWEIIRDDPSRNAEVNALEKKLATPQNNLLPPLKEVNTEL